MAVALTDDREVELESNMLQQLETIHVCIPGQQSVTRGNLEGPGSGMAHRACRRPTAPGRSTQASPAAV